MTILMLLILLGAAFGAAADFDSAMPSPEWHAVTIEGHHGVVLPRSDAGDLVGADHQGIWLPSDARLIEAERAMEGASIVRGGSEVRPELDGYRQYAGFIEDGDRKIAINSFCTEIGNWRREVVVVMDGGACFWGATYNVDTGRVERLRINGDA